MKRPENIIKTKEYIETYTFENDQEAILFYAYLEQEKYIDELEKQLTLTDVVASFPSTKEIESRLKQVVDESFEDFEVVEKREYSLGFRACYNWLKIKQMKK